MTQVLPALPGTTIVSCEYNPAGMPEGAEAGLGWAILHDNTVLGWLADETGATPVKPIIIGTMPGDGPDTGEIKSPVWMVREGGNVFIPDQARGTTNEFFNYIAYNNGARRPLYANFSDTNLSLEFKQWASANPGMALSAPPNVSAEPPPPEGGLTSRRDDESNETQEDAQARRNAGGPPRETTVAQRTRGNIPVPE